MTKKRILLAEDEQDINESICSYFSLHGFDIDGAADGLEAKEKLQSRKYNLIISDLRMPKMDGIELLNFATRHMREIPFIVISAYSDVPARELMQKGAHSFVEKPIDLKLLKETALKALASGAGI